MNVSVLSNTSQYTLLFEAEQKIMPTKLKDDSQFDQR